MKVLIFVFCIVQILGREFSQNGEPEANEKSKWFHGVMKGWQKHLDKAQKHLETLSKKDEAELTVEDLEGINTELLGNVYCDPIPKFNECAEHCKVGRALHEKDFGYSLEQKEAVAILRCFDSCKSKFIDSPVRGCMFPDKEALEFGIEAAAASPKLGFLDGLKDKLKKWYDGLPKEKKATYGTLIGVGALVVAVLFYTKGYKIFSKLINRCKGDSLEDEDDHWTTGAADKIFAMCGCCGGDKDDGGRLLDHEQDSGRPMKMDDGNHNRHYSMNHTFERV